MKRIISLITVLCMVCSMFLISTAEEIFEIKIENVDATTTYLTLLFNEAVAFDFDKKTKEAKNIYISDSLGEDVAISEVKMSEDNKTAYVKFENPLTLITDDDTTYTVSIPYIFSHDMNYICFNLKAVIKFHTYWQDDFESYIGGDGKFDTKAFGGEEKDNSLVGGNYRFLNSSRPGFVATEAGWSSKYVVGEDDDGNRALKIASSNIPLIEIKKYDWSAFPGDATYEFDVWSEENSTGSYGFYMNFYLDKDYVWKTDNGSGAFFMNSDGKNSIFIQKGIVPEGTTKTLPMDIDFRNGKKTTVSLTKTNINTDLDSNANTDHAYIKMTGDGKEIFNEQLKISRYVNKGFYFSFASAGIVEYIDNLKFYKSQCDLTQGTTCKLSYISNVRLTGEFLETKPVQCVFDEVESYAGLYGPVNVEYEWYTGNDYFAEFPGEEWNKQEEVTDKYTLSAQDLEGYVVCRVIRSLNVPVKDGAYKLILSDEKSLPMAKPSAPVCHNNSLEYKKEADKEFLIFTYEYFDANMDAENATMIKWEESSDNTLWTVSSINPTNITDNGVTTSKLEVTDIIDKYIRCTVKVKNDEPLFGDSAEEVTLSYTMPFKPVANPITVSGTCQVNSALTAKYTYSDVNGDKQKDSEIMWVKKDAYGNETVISQNSLNYFVQPSDAGYSIAFCVIPTTDTYPEKGDRTYSTFMAVPVPEPVYTPSISSGGGSGGSYIGYKDTSNIKDEDTTPVIKEETSDTPVDKTEFIDIKNHWAEKDINSLCEKGYLKGRSETSFEPDGKITRAEWLTLLLRGAEIDADTEYNNSFSDIAKDTWYAKIVLKALELKIIEGSDGKFNPDSPITREQMAKMAIEVYEYKTEKTAKIENIDGFSDANEISSWAEEYVKKSVGIGIMNGMNETEFSPKSEATRAQAAVMLGRFILQLQ